MADRRLGQAQQLAQSPDVYLTLGQMQEKRQRVSSPRSPKNWHKSLVSSGPMANFVFFAMTLLLNGP